MYLSPSDTKTILLPIIINVSKLAFSKVIYEIKSGIIPQSFRYED